MQEVLLFDPETLPAKGLLSYPVPSALSLGEFQDLINVRLDDRSIRCRAGQYQESTVPDVDSGTGGVQSGTFYGGAIFKKNKSGDFWAVVALDVGGSVVRLFYNIYTAGAWTGWSLAVNGNDQTAQTMSLPAFGYYEFVQVSNGSGGIDGFYVQNGTDKARFFSTTSGSPIGYIVSDLEAPRQVSSVAPVIRPKSGIDVRTGAMVASFPVSGTHYTSDGCFDDSASSGTSGGLSQSGSSPDFLWTALTGTGGTALPTVGDFGWFRCHANDEADFTGCKQVAVFYSGGDDTWFTCLKWYLTGTTSGDMLMHDPSGFKDSHFKVPTKQSGVKMAVFSIADHAGKTLTDINGIKFEVTDAALTAASTLSIRGVLGLGSVPFGAQYAACFGYGVPAIMESSGVLYDSNAKACRVVDFGVSMDEDQLLPLDARCLYTPDVPIFAPTAAQAALGATEFKVYRRDPGEAELLVGNSKNGDFSLIASTTVALYDTGSGNGPGSTDRWETVYATFGNDEQAWSEKASAGTLLDTTTPDDKDFTDRCPGPYTVSMPIGSSVCYANGCVFVAGARGTGSAARNSGVFVSEKDRPGRYTNVSGDVQLLDRGLFHSLEDENGIKVLAVSTSLIGLSSVYVWSDRRMWEVSGIAPVRVCDMGTVAKDSVASQNGRLYWVSQDLEVVRAFNGTIDGLSRYTVHDKLVDVPAARRKYMSGAIKGSRYYLAHASSSNNGNHRVLVWNDDLGAFESDDSVPTTVPVSQFFPWNGGSDSRLIFFTSSGQMWEYEKEGEDDDNGTNIDITVHTGELTADWERITVGQCKVVCTSQSATVTILRTARFPAATKEGTFSASGGGSETSAWRVDTTATVKSPPSLSGCSVDLKLTATVDHPFAIHSWKAKYKTNQGKGARANQ